MRERRGWLYRPFSPSFSRRFAMETFSTGLGYYSANSRQPVSTTRRLRTEAVRARARFKGLSRPQEFRGDSAAVGEHDRSLSVREKKGLRESYSYMYTYRVFPFEDR